MATAREIKNRIKSVKNIAQITRAMEAVAAARVRKAQARVLASRAFALKAWEILLNVQNTSKSGTPLHPLLTPRTEINNVMIVLITSDRGLKGAFNTNIIRVAHRFASRLGKPVRYVAVGQKGRDSLVRSGENMVAQFTNLPADPSVSDISPIARLAIDEFLAGHVDEVFIAYTDYINTLTQRPSVLSWLPLIPYHTDDQVAAEFIKDAPHVSEGAQVYEYEPSAEAILNEIVPRFTELQLYQAILESQASEYSAQMVAMRNASDNADALTQDLTLVYNKARQGAITSEILDIVGGAEALQASINSVAHELVKVMETTPQKAPAPAKPVKSKPESRGEPDDLTRIEGIGGKMATALNAAGITTFARLAETSEDDLRAAIKAAGMRFSPSLPTWAQQAAIAAKGDWTALERFQETLVAGRKA
jgi:F-type H+-transporting ATPase subunit gamma